MTNHSSLTIKANFVIRVPPSTYAEWWETNLLQIQTELARKPQPYQYNKYSANEKADISKYSTDVLQFPYLLYHLCNHKFKPK